MELSQKLHRNPSISTVVANEVAEILRKVSVFICMGANKLISINRSCSIGSGLPKLTIAFPQYDISHMT